MAIGVVKRLPGGRPEEWFEKFTNAAIIPAERNIKTGL